MTNPVPRWPRTSPWRQPRACYYGCESRGAQVLCQILHCILCANFGQVFHPDGLAYFSKSVKRVLLENKRTRAFDPLRIPGIAARSLRGATMSRRRAGPLCCNRFAGCGVQRHAARTHARASVRHAARTHARAQLLWIVGCMSVGAATVGIYGNNNDTNLQHVRPRVHWHT